MVLDEAKILGIPIVATAYPTVYDQIAEGKEGVITPISGEGIAQGVERLLRDQGQMAAIRTYLAAEEYGNTYELSKYIDLIDG